MPGHALMCALSNKMNNDRAGFNDLRLDIWLPIFFF